MKVLDVFSALESRFGRLYARDQAILAPDKVIMFLRAVDVWDLKDLGVLLEDTTMESGLTDRWKNVRCRENPSLCADRETEPPGFWTRRI